MSDASNQRVRSATTSAGDLPEPGVSAVPAPVWLWVLLAVLACWAVWFLGRRAGGFHAKVYLPYASSEMLQAMLPKPEDDTLFATGRRAFGAYCVVCHQATGRGLPGQFPPLAGSEWVVAPTPDRLIRLVLDGVQGPINVRGGVFHGAMPPWRDLLKDEEIAAVLTYIRRNKSWGNDAPEVTAEQVQTIRAQTADRAGNAWTADELVQVPLGK